MMTSRSFMPEAWSQETNKSSEFSWDEVFAVHASNSRDMLCLAPCAPPLWSGSGLIFDWPTTVLPFSASLWKRVVERIAVGVRSQALLKLFGWEREPEWEQPISGIHCKLLATDAKRGRVSMLVRLTPSIEYPPHTHTGVEELHLLQGELWIDRRKLRPGDYNRAEPGTADQRVWSETGCTCLLITSSHDIIN